MTFIMINTRTMTSGDVGMLRKVTIVALHCCMSRIGMGRSLNILRQVVLGFWDTEIGQPLKHTPVIVWGVSSLNWSNSVLQKLYHYARPATNKILMTQVTVKAQMTVETDDITIGPIREVDWFYKNLYFLKM